MKSIGQIAYEACFSSQRVEHDSFSYPRKWDDIAAAVERAVGLKLKQDIRKLKAEKRLYAKALKAMAMNHARIEGEMKREKRVMWHRLSVNCRNYSPIAKTCYGHVAKTQPCSMSSCPLLNKAVKQ
jgi:ribosomal protein L32